MTEDMKDTPAPKQGRARSADGGLRKGAGDAAASSLKTREDRLAEALRANLRRRKSAAKKPRPE